jgi:hypothetical protein
MGEMKQAYKLLVGIDQLEDLGDGRIILEWILNRAGGCGLD